MLISTFAESIGMKIALSGAAIIILNPPGFALQALSLFFQKYK